MPATAQQAHLDPAPDKRVAQLEMDFLMGMIPHHRSAVVMAQMALEKADHPQLRNMAQSIIASQQQQIQVMTNYLRDWYGVEAPTSAMMSQDMMAAMDMPMLHGTMPDMDQQMMSLQSKSGADFETGFLQSMSAHHAMAVMMSGSVLMSGYHSDLRTLAEDIALDQTQEIRQMHDWLNAWYGIK